mmetsp:Transcript_5463/g.9552  ORF Transcript_5463/g.9552 Transcript_5463/m.9552 type:complete len:498 (-) Transcript_5463:150-1643(-)
MASLIEQSPFQPLSLFKCQETFSLLSEMDDSTSSTTSRKRPRHGQAPPLSGAAEEEHESSSTRSSRKRGKRKAKIIEECLGEEYQPTDEDVICARGKEAQNHPGNVRFRQMIDLNLGEYRQAHTKKEKTTIVAKIIQNVRSSPPAGLFVRKHDDGKWYETGDDFAREKIGQCFRDRLHTEYRSSSRAKISRRKENVKEHKHIDFDEYVANIEPAIEEGQRSRISKTAGTQQILDAKWNTGPSARKRPPPSGEFMRPSTRPRTAFQGLAETYFGDVFNTASAMDQHLDLLGTLPQTRSNLHHFSAPSRGAPDVVASTSSSMMGQPFNRSLGLGHLPGEFSNPRAGRLMPMLNNTNSFASLPANAFFNDRNSSYCVGENVSISDAMIDQSQRVSTDPMGASLGGSLEPLDPRKVGDSFDVSALEAAKGLAFVPETAWQTKTERKPPPMPSSIFDTSFDQEANDQNFSGQPRPGSAQRFDPSQLDQSGSSKIDDEPLPLE